MSDRSEYANVTRPGGTIGQILAGAASSFANRTAIVDGDSGTSYTDLYRRALRFSNALRDHGVSDGYRVALLMPNGIDFVVAYYGSLLAGAVVVPLNPLQRGEALLAQLLDSGANAAVVHADSYPTFAAVAERTPIDAVVVSGKLTHVSPSLTAPVIDMDNFIDAQPFSPGQPPPTADGLAHLAFTGGTTGRPKAVRVFHRHVIANVAQLTAWRCGRRVVATAAGLQIDPKPLTHQEYVLRPGVERALVIAPFFHAHGLVSLSFFMLNGFTVVIFQGRFEPQRFLREVEARRTTYLTASPPVYSALVAVPGIEEMDLSSVKIAASGAAPLGSVVRRRLSQTLPTASVAEAYGLTEATMAVTATPGIRGVAPTPGSVGEPLPDTEIEIHDRSDPERVLGVDEPGEVWVRGPQVCAGYLSDDGGDEQFGNGWLRTGDIGALDSGGSLRLLDRAKDMMIYKGYNVYPRELEEVIAEVPGVAKVAVVGRPHEIVGEEPVAFVVVTNGERPSTQLIKDHLAERLLPYKQVREVFYVNELPQSPAGKVLKRELRSQLAVPGDGEPGDAR